MAMNVRRKRTYASAFGGRRRANFKKRRTTARRRRGSNAVTQTTQSGYGRSLPFRSKKISRRSWNSKLWNSTLQKAHYRSNGSAAGAVVTPATNTTMGVVFAQAVDNGVGAFWTSAGGAQSIDGTTAVPTFRDDIIIRGGMIGLSFYNDSTTDPVEVCVWLIKNSPRPAAGIAAMPSTVSVGWDPTLFAEFSKDIGYVKYKTKFLLEPNASSTIERRLGIQKIDQEAWATDQQRWIWLIATRDFDNTTTNTIRVVNYHNLSFAGDAG